MPEKTLILTVGLPRSGKSSWARCQGYPVVNPDSIRLRLHGQVFAPQAEPFVWAVAHLMVESLFEAGHSTVILDATNISRRRRRGWRTNSARWSTHATSWPGPWKSSGGWRPRRRRNTCPYGTP